METLTTKPSTFHSAFNPILFVVTADTKPDKPYTLKIGIGKIVKTQTPAPPSEAGLGGEPGIPGGNPYDENIVSLTRPFIQSTKDGVVIYEAKFDVSGAIRNYFKMTPPLMTQDIEVDKRLYVQYYVGTDLYVAINAIFNIGENSDMGKYVNAILTHFPFLRKYAGYDFDVSILCNQTTPYGFTMNAVNRVKQPFIPLDYLAEHEGELITDHDGDLITINGAKIVDAVTPRNPFYIRWINRLGGVDYWMFGMRQKTQIDVKDVNTLKSYYETSEGASHSETTYSVTNENTIIVGASNISVAEWDILSLLPMSPQIEWYNEKLNKWQVINIKKGDSSRDTDRTLLSIEFTFLLPAFEVQFS